MGSQRKVLLSSFTLFFVCACLLPSSVVLQLLGKVFVMTQACPSLPSGPLTGSTLVGMFQNAGIERSMRAWCRAPGLPVFGVSQKVSLKGTVVLVIEFAKDHRL